MNKKKAGFIFLVVLFILLAGLAQANIIIDPPAKETYNLGETVKVTGYVLPNEDFRGRFRIKLVCQNEENELLVKLYDFEKEKKLEFNESLFILSSKSGECYFNLVLDDLKEVKEAEKSHTITISDQLILDASLDKKDIQLGEKISLKGTVKNLIQKPVDGSVTIRVVRETETFITASFIMENGKFNSSFGPIFMPSGEYQLLVSAKDIFGNQAEKTFLFNVTSQIDLKAVVDKTEADPGEILYLSGKVSYSQYEPKINYLVKLNFAGKDYQFPKKEETFSYDLPVPENQKAGKELLQITVTDNFGNNGQETFEITISQKPVSLELNLDKSELKPEANLTFSAKLLDQAGQPISEPVVLELSQDKKVLWKNYSLPGQAQKYLVPPLTPPKKIILTAKYKNLAEIKEIMVLDDKKIQSYLEGSQIVIENIGNVPYQEIMDFTLIGDKKYTINKKIDLQPGEKVKLDFNKDVPANNYTLIVPSDPSAYNISVLKKEITESLAGATKEMTQEISKIRRIILYIMVVILVLLFLTFYFYSYYRHHTSKIKKMLGIKMDHYEKKVNHYKTETFVHQQEAEKAKSEKDKIHELFNKFADKEIVKEIISQPDLAHGEEREITVMFADLCDFTQLCEKTQLSSIREILNEYFESMYLTVKKNRGVVNEYLGDALFVLFNAPNKIINHPLAGIKTALAMKEELKNLNQKLVQKGYNPLEISIGLNTGKAKIGILGVNRIKYAAIGDTVNTAARLEGEAKHGEILINQEMYNLVKNDIDVQPLGQIKVKHKEIPLRVYKVMGMKSR